MVLLPGLTALGVASTLTATKNSVVTSIRPKLQSKQEPPVSSQPTESKERVTFQLQLISDGILCPIDNPKCADSDIWWKDFALLAPNGHTLHLTSIPFPSVDQCKAHFQTSVQDAEKILRQSPESDSKGEPIGERALGSFPAVKDTKPPWGVPHYKLFWTWGKNYLEIQGEHLEDVLALESRLKEEGINAVWSWHKPYER